MARVDMSRLQTMTTALAVPPPTPMSGLPEVERRHHSLTVAPPPGAAIWRLSAHDVDPSGVTNFIIGVRSRTYHPSVCAAAVMDTVYEPTADRVRCLLWTGGELIEEPLRLRLHGDADELSISEVVDAIRRRGWRRVKLVGTPDFVDALSIALASEIPPIEVINRNLPEEIMERLTRSQIDREGSPSGRLAS